MHTHCSGNSNISHQRSFAANATVGASAMCAFMCVWLVSPKHKTPVRFSIAQPNYVAFELASSYSSYIIIFVRLEAWRVRHPVWRWWLHTMWACGTRVHMCVWGCVHAISVHSNVRNVEFTRSTRRCTLSLSTRTFLLNNDQRWSQHTHTHTRTILILFVFFFSLFLSLRCLRICDYKR